MEKIEHDFYDDDCFDLDDVLDQSFFTKEEDLTDSEEEDDVPNKNSNHFRPISEL
ncbi:MAG: hypothetical protein RJQ14_13060 [Marinoscillum sp.]